MKDLDLTSLRYFVAACELSSISLAAEQQNIVTSAMSKRLAQLEDDLGTPLLSRRRQGVVPTSAGEFLLARARELLASASDIQQELSSTGGRLRGRVHLLAAMSVIAEQLPDDLAAFLARPEYSEVQVEIEEGLTRDIAKKIRNGSASVGILWDAANLAGLESRPYRDDQLAVVIHASHALADRTECAYEDTLEYPRVGLQASSTTNEMLARAAGQQGRPPANRAMVSTFEACIKIVKANLAISVMPLQIARPYSLNHGLRVVPLTDAWAARQFVLCFRDRRRLSPATMALVDFLHRQAHPVAR